MSAANQRVITDADVVFPSEEIIMPGEYSIRFVYILAPELKDTVLECHWTPHIPPAEIIDGILSYYKSARAEFLELIALLFGAPDPDVESHGILAAAVKPDSALLQ